MRWSDWNATGAGASWTVGIEEEVMLLDPEDWTLASRIDSVLPVLDADLEAHVGAETHSSALELRTDPNRTVHGAIGQLTELRRRLRHELGEVGLRTAAAGMHPFAVWHDTLISEGERYQFLYGSMRELARREPTFALHVHVAVPDAEGALRSLNRMRAHVPLLLALSANSPFWQGRDTGLASARTPLFQAFPRVGLPRAFDDYADYVDTIDLLLRCEAFPEPTFLWWDVRLQPRFGTLEVRIMDAQTSLDQSAALVALTQCLVRLEAGEHGFAAELLVGQPEVLSENRFLAARDGVRATMIDPDAGRRVPVSELLARVLGACRPHAEELGCVDELELVLELERRPGAERQLEEARHPDKLVGLVKGLAEAF